MPNLQSDVILRVVGHFSQLRLAEVGMDVKWWERFAPWRFLRDMARPVLRLATVKEKHVSKRMVAKQATRYRDGSWGRIREREGIDQYLKLGKAGVARRWTSRERSTKSYVRH